DAVGLGDARPALACPYQTSDPLRNVCARHSIHGLFFGGHDVLQSRFENRTCNGTERGGPPAGGSLRAQRRQIIPAVRRSGLDSEELNAARRIVVVTAQT